MNRNVYFPDPKIRPPLTDRPWAAIIAAPLLIAAVSVPFTPWLSDSDIAAMGPSADTVPLVEAILPPGALSSDMHGYVRRHRDDAMAVDSIGQSQPTHRPRLQLAWARSL
jgi:hypothetical protein